MLEASVIGLGTMGATLARLLIQNGYRVTVWNRTIAKADPLVPGQFVWVNRGTGMAGSTVLAMPHRNASATLGQALINKRR